MNEYHESMLRAYFRGKQFDAPPDLSSRIQRALPKESPSWVRGHRFQLAGAGVALGLVLTVGVATAEGKLGVITENMLQQVGLASLVGVSQSHHTATASGYTVRVVGTYADVTRTAILLDVQPNKVKDHLISPGDVYLLDASGHRVSGRGGSGTGEGSSFLFNALPGVEKGAVKATVHVSSLIDMANEGYGGNDTEIKGDWKIPVVIRSQGGKIQPLPEPGMAGPNLSVTFNSVRIASGAISVDATLQGSDLAHFNTPPVSGTSFAPPPLLMQVFDKNGKELQFAEVGPSLSEPSQPNSSVQKWSGVWFTSSSQGGPYHIRITSSDGKVLDRVIPGS